MLSRKHFTPQFYEDFRNHQKQNELVGKIKGLPMGGQILPINGLLD